MSRRYTKRPGRASWLRRIEGDAQLMIYLARDIVDTDGLVDFTALAERLNVHEARLFSVLANLEKTGRVHVLADGTIKHGPTPTPHHARRRREHTTSEQHDRTPAV